MICPACGYNNIEGMDRCENCMKPLRDLDIPRAEAATGIVRSVMEHDLRHLPEREALTVRTNEQIADVARRMAETSAGCALVIEGDAGTLAGLFTEHDAVRALIANSALTVGEAMTRDVLPLAESETIANALSRMTIGETRFVAVQHTDGRCSLISARGVLKYIAGEDW